MKLSIVLPCYNEAKNISLIYEKLKMLEINPQELEFVFVNNGSYDNSADILLKIKSHFEFVKILTIDENKGYGFGIISGLKECTGEFVGWTHSDMQTDIDDILVAYGLLRKLKFNKNIYIKGKREGRPLYDQFFTKSMSVFGSIFLKHRFVDISAQPNIIHKSLFLAWGVPPRDYLFDLFAMYKAGQLGLELVRFPVLFPYRKYGKSKWNTGLLSRWKLIKRVIEYSLELKYKN